MCGLYDASRTMLFDIKRALRIEILKSIIPSMLAKVNIKLPIIIYRWSLFGEEIPFPKEISRRHCLDNAVLMKAKNTYGTAASY